MRFILPFIDLVLNGFLLYKLVGLLGAYFEFEYLVLLLFFLFFVLVCINSLFKNLFTFLANRRTFSMLFIVQFLASLLIIQLLGWLFSIYLTFVFMLIYLFFTNQPKTHNVFLHICGITVGGLFLYINFF